MLCAVSAGKSDSDIGRGFGIQNNGECGSTTRFCGEQIARAVGAACLGNGDAGGVVVGCFESCGGCFSAGITTCIGGGGGECGGDVAIEEVFINAGDGDGLRCIPVVCSEGQR